MINGAVVTLAGYVATEPYYRTTDSNKTPVVSMRVAWTSRFIDRETGEWRDGNTSFANVKCWRKLASNVAPSLRKGQAIVLTGRLQVRDFDDKEGRRRVAVDIEADAIGHDLSRGVAHFQRTLRSAGEAAADGTPGGLAMGEAIRAGLAGQDLAGPEDDASGRTGDAACADGEAPGRSSAGAAAGGEAATSGDVFAPEAINELAGATAQNGTAAPF